MYGSAAQAPAVQCPFCHSTQVQAGKRGWKWYAGYVGSGNTVWTCQSCGKTF
jgi:transposase-like protein